MKGGVCFKTFSFDTTLAKPRRADKAEVRQFASAHIIGPVGLEGCVGTERSELLPPHFGAGHGEHRTATTLRDFPLVN
jgi:hypothetical protein